MTRIAWSKRLVKLFAVALLIATTCLALGIWQIARLHQKRQFNAAVRAGLSAPPAPAETLLPDGVDPEAVRYRRVEATGTYDTAHEFVLYGRTQDSDAGNHLLTPLRFPDGRSILVDRGWVPLAVDSPGAASVAPPSGEVHVEGVLFASEGDPPGAAGRAGGTETTLAKLDLASIQAQLPYRIAPDLPAAATADARAVRPRSPPRASPRALRRPAPKLCPPMVHVRGDRDRLGSSSSRCERDLIPRSADDERVG